MASSTNSDIFLPFKYFESVTPYNNKSSLFNFIKFPSFFTIFFFYFPGNKKRVLLTSISPTLALSKSGYGSKSILTLSKKLPVSFIIIFLIKIVYFYSYYLCFCSNYKRRCFHEIMYYSR